MAHGEEFDSGRGRGGRHHTSTYLLDRATSQGDGPWVDVRGACGLSLEVQGLTKDVACQVEIRGTNRFAPSPAYLGHQMGAAIIDDGMTLISGPVAWLRACIPEHAAAPADPLTVILHAVA